jgi:hypothetical protein
MAPRRTYQRWAFVLAVGVLLVVLGVQHSMIALIRGVTVGDEVLGAGAKQQQIRDEQRQQQEQAVMSTPETVAPGATGPPKTLRDTAVWNFTHRSSAHNAVTSVRGLPIESIHPYLKKKSSGRWIGIHPNDLRISPLLPKVEANLSSTSRLVFMDLGARMYPGSTGWFLKHYPRSREFNVIVFELLDLENTYNAAKPYFRSFTYERKAAWTHSKGVAIKGMRMARVDDNVVVQRGDNRQTWLSPSVDVAEYIMSNFTKNDFVVVKLDIEGGEWTLIPHLVRTGAIAYIDEVFFECHPMDFDDYQREPNRLPAICVDFINDLRRMGVYCHRWF